MKRILIAGGALAALGAGPAMAADSPAREPAAHAAPPRDAVVGSWAGFYFGGNVGGAWLRASETFINDLGAVDRLSFRSSSAFGSGSESAPAGPQVGLQGQWGNLVLGIEGSFSGTDLERTVSSVNPGSPRTRSLKVDHVAAVVGKAGLGGGRWLLYARGGWAGLRANPSSFNPANGVSSSVTDWHGGWTVGTGSEFMFTRNWIPGVEFDYYTARFDGAQPFSSRTMGSVTNSRADVYAVIGRLSYRFNWGSAAGKE